MTPFYRSGLGWIISKTPTRLGKKAAGYYHPKIPHRSIRSSLSWQIKKLWAQYKGSLSYEKDFDLYVANKIKRGEYKAKVLITLQDYMPNSVKAARDKGFRVWSDQIINQSIETFERIELHLEKYSLPLPIKHSEENNKAIVSSADLITIPSTYCLQGIKEQIPQETTIALVPYGASSERFFPPKNKNDEEIIILARAQSIRKGGHLLLEALLDCASELISLAKPKKIKVKILGKYEKALISTLEKIRLPPEIKIEHENIPHTSVPLEYQKASIFVMPSLSEGRSLACLEAMHASLPLIITPYCGIDGFIHGKMGYLISDTSTSLSSALIDAFSQKENWPTWGAEARSLAEGYTWEKYEQKISQIASEALCKK